MQDVISAIVSILIYFIVCDTSAILLRVLTKIEDEVFRKLLHMILLGSLFVWMEAFPTWQSAAASALIFAALVYPILWFAERFKG